MNIHSLAFESTTSSVQPRSAFPSLDRIQCVLRERFTRVWPTRHKALCPPAYAAMLMTDTLGIPELMCDKHHAALVVFLPEEFDAQLATLAGLAPQILVQADISLERSSPYLSWSLPVPASAPPAALPLTLWVGAETPYEQALRNEMLLGVAMMAVVFVTAKAVAFSKLEVTEQLRLQMDHARAACKQRPQGYEQAALLKKARDKALRYGERPWLFMRYELKNQGQRLAVHWAPGGRIIDSGTEAGLMVALSGTRLL